MAEPTPAPAPKASVTGALQEVAGLAKAKGDTDLSARLEKTSADIKTDVTAKATAAGGMDKLTAADKFRSFNSAFKANGLYEPPVLDRMDKAMEGRPDLKGTVEKAYEAAIRQEQVDAVKTTFNDKGVGMKHDGSPQGAPDGNPNQGVTAGAPQTNRSRVT